ncbi:MAG: 5-methylthioadenosine/S-adenosylhomocysteine deaminase [Candidatus Azotimanducaceae bacterium]
MFNVKLSVYLRVLTVTAACFISIDSSAATLIKNATIMTLAEGDDSAFVGYVLIEGKKISAVAAGAVPVGVQADTVIDAAGKIVMPGFVSGHNHLWQSAFRGIAADKELYGWLSDLHWTYGAYFGDGDFYNFTLHGALDQLSRGITTSYNHSQRLDGTEAQYLESFQAELDAGQHFIFSYNANMRQTNEAITKDFETFIATSKKYIGSSPLLAVSVHSVGSYSGGDKLKLEMDIAKKHGLTAQIHYLEEYQRRFADRRKWPDFLSAGAVADGVSYAHFIHTTDKILNDTALNGASMIWNPLSNGRLASGLADIPRYLEMGIAVGMGVDGAASADIADPFENMRMGMYALRMQHRNANVMLPVDVLRLHTLATAKVLKVDNVVGSLEEGKLADLLIIDPGTGVFFDTAATLVLATNASDIETIYVAGKPVVNEGLLLHHDMSAIKADLLTRVGRIVAAEDE